MGALVEYVNKVANMELDKVAEDIEAEMKAIVSEHSRSGEALSAIHIEKNGEYSRLIGASGNEGAKHLYYLDQGNAGSGKRIYPKTSKALYLKDYDIYRGAVNAYDGIHFLKKIADKYNG